MQDYFMVQCTLKKGDTTMHSWIPESFAVLNNYVKIRDRGGNWDDGWQITQCGARLQNSMVELKSQEYKKHRNRTDV